MRLRDASAAMELFPRSPALAGHETKKTGDSECHVPTTKVLKHSWVKVELGRVMGVKEKSSAGIRGRREGS